MGLSYRKTLTGKNLKVNVTSSGSGLSAGLGPARISIGPRGVNVFGTKAGFRYYQSLNPFLKNQLPLLKLLAFVIGVFLAIYVPELRIPLAILFLFWVWRRGQNR